MTRHQGNKKANREYEVASVATSPTDMLNFHFASSPPSHQSHMNQPRRRNTNRQRQDRQQYQRSEQDRSSARRKVSSNMFHLHSSSAHTFILTRIAKQGYSFSGPDSSVSWEAVKAVRYLSPTTSAEPGKSNEQELTAALESCTICLDTFTCPRITKCGHCFCLPCLLRYFQTSSETNSYSFVKCPCCGIPIHTDDIRPVIIESVSTPKVNSKMSFVKLHRAKGCSSPYIPQRGQWKRSSPNAVPSMADDDARFSRFTYVDPAEYMALLHTNQRELSSYASVLQLSKSDLELFFVQMALERVNNCISSAQTDLAEEQFLIERFGQIQAGIYQPIPDYLFASSSSSSQTEQVIESVHSEDPEFLSSPKNSVGSEREQRFRAESICSTESEPRPSGESIGSEGEASSSFGRPSRGFSMDSADSSGKTQGKNQQRARRLPLLQASLYLEDQSSQFYQAADGQLFFLSKFNMNCLIAEFSTSIPKEPVPHSESSRQYRKSRPLPDVVEGTVIEIEPFHLTPEMRKRMPFLSHLPFFTDIFFVELELNKILSDETRKCFQDEFEKRKKRRKSRASAEKRADRHSKRQEEERINELKARLQRVDPKDEFFQSTDPEPGSMTGEAFGPTIDGHEPTSPSLQPRDPVLSFSAVVNTPSSMAMTEEAYPSLGSPSLGPSSVAHINTPTWGSGWHANNAIPPKTIERNEDSSSSPSRTPGSSGKKSKKEKIVLFSTGSHRGGY